MTENEDSKLEALVKIRFDPSSRSAGYALALGSNSVTYTADPFTFIVPESTVRRLQEEKISFTFLDPKPR